MKLFAREADKICSECDVYGLCRSVDHCWTKRRKVLKKTGECTINNTIKERQNKLKKVDGEN